MTTNVDITAAKICEKKSCDNRLACDEIIHFDSDEFEHGEPKSIETLKKLASFVNKEVPLEKKYVSDIPIGYVDAGQHNEIKGMLTPIRRCT